MCPVHSSAVRKETFFLQPQIPHSHRKHSGVTNSKKEIFRELEKSIFNLLVFVCVTINPPPPSFSADVLGWDDWILDDQPLAFPSHIMTTHNDYRANQWSRTSESLMFHLGPAVTDKDITSCNKVCRKRWMIPWYIQQIHLLVVFSDV